MMIRRWLDKSLGEIQRDRCRSCARDNREDNIVEVSIPTIRRSVVNTAGLRGIRERCDQSFKDEKTLPTKSVGESDGEECGGWMKRRRVCVEEENARDE